jgi:hypothetical protein
MKGPRGLVCKNGHLVATEGGAAADFCPTCGIKLQEAHPFAVGALFGFVSSMIVSTLELLSLNYSVDSSAGPLILVGAVPGVFVLSAGLGAAYLRKRYGNTIGIGRILYGTIPVFVMFFLLWIGVLFALALVASCGDGTC